MENRKGRVILASLAVSASALTGITLYEGFSATPYTPIKGDVLTQGYGRTEGVEEDSPPVSKREALQWLKSDISKKYEAAVKKCVRVPLHQYEYDAYVSLTYNIGGRAFCNSSLVKKLNSGDYTGACKEILRWDKFKGKSIQGLTNRRAKEYDACLNISEND